jgi:hypothetical protein
MCLSFSKKKDRLAADSKNSLATSTHTRPQKQPNVTPAF